MYEHLAVMSDIEELAQLLGQPGEDLDWGGEHFCFLEYEHDETVVADQQLHLPQQHLHQPPNIMASEDCSSGNKRRMSEAFQCQAYPSHTCGPVLVPAPTSACLSIILNSSTNSSNSNSSDSSVSSTSATTPRNSSRSSSRQAQAQHLSVQAREEEDSLSFSSVAASCSKASTPTASSSCFSDEAEQEQLEQLEQSTGAAAAVGSRTEAVAQRMERKKTREKMRRQEVNDKFNELMEALSEADSKGQTPAEKQQQKQQQQAQAANIDKGNFRVDVLSRAVRVIKRLNEEVKTEQAEVERLRAQLEQTSLVKQEVQQSQEQQQQQEETALVTPSSSSESNKPSTSSTSSSSNSSNKMNSPMTWVTVPMWMPSGPNAGHAEHAAAMAQAKGILLDSSSNGVNDGGNGSTFPFATMPFFVPHHAGGHMVGQNGGVVGMPSMMMPAGGVAMAMSMGFGGNGEGGMGVRIMNAGGPATSFAGGEVGEEEAPTHAPCA